MRSIFCSITSTLFIFYNIVSNCPVSKCHQLIHSTLSSISSFYIYTFYTICQNFKFHIICHSPFFLSICVSTADTIKKIKILLFMASGNLNGIPIRIHKGKIPIRRKCIYISYRSHIHSNSQI